MWLFNNREHDDGAAEKLYGGGEGGSSDPEGHGLKTGI